MYCLIVYSRNTVWVLQHCAELSHITERLWVAQRFTVLGIRVRVVDTLCVHLGYRAITPIEKSVSSIESLGLDCYHLSIRSGSLLASVMNCFWLLWAQTPNVQIYFRTLASHGSLQLSLDRWTDGKGKGEGYADAFGDLCDYEDTMPDLNTSKVSRNFGVLQLK